MIYLKEFDSHASYESEVNGVGVMTLMMYILILTTQ